MKTTAICFLFIAVFAGMALADCQTTPCSLACRMVDWMDEPGTGFLCEGYPDWPPGYDYSGTAYWDLAMGDSFLVWLPGNTQMTFVDLENHAELDTTIDPHSGSENIVLCAIQDSVFFTGGEYICIA